MTEIALPDPQPYDRVQRSFHWGMAAIIIVALVIGLAGSFLVPGTPLRRALLEWHKSLGLTALALVVLRIAYRLATRNAPAHEAGPAARAAAHAAHLALYGLMLGMPLTGYLYSGAGGYSLPWFGLFQWPRLVPLDEALSALGASLHAFGADALYAVLGLHLLAVIWHQFVRRDRVLARMWPRR
ncbi:cytochrome b [Methylobacterium sp. ID0610]|uniref:cytochrome b n=1 Tax=Methylobacterium carpenticola TaxID=3344827 RepID=UPI0036A54BC9